MGEAPTGDIEGDSRPRLGSHMKCLVITARLGSVACRPVVARVHEDGGAEDVSTRSYLAYLRARTWLPVVTHLSGMKKDAGCWEVPSAWRRCSLRDSSLDISCCAAWVIDGGVI